MKLSLTALTLASWSLLGPGAARADDAVPVKAGAASAAILGDSLATGAATHPALAFDGKALWEVFSGATPVRPTRLDLPQDLGFLLADPLSPPRRLWPTTREFFGGPDWVYRNALQTVSRAYLDTEEYSWGYLTARGLGVAPDRILVAAENGARVEVMPRHVDRVLEANGGVLPDVVLVLYTGNDLCGLTLDQVTPADEFEAGLSNGFSYLVRNGLTGERGTDVYLLSYLGILQLLHDQAILGKSVRAFGGEMSCKELRESGYRPRDPAYDPKLPPEAWYFGVVMPPNPAAFCPTLFGGGGDDREETVSVLANRIREYREREVRVVEAARREAASSQANIRFHHIGATADLVFGAADIAEDCFHLSPSGQAKVARAVLQINQQ